MTDRINLLQARVSAQLQAADALQAKLTSQQTVLTAMLHALDVTTFGKKE